MSLPTVCPQRSRGIAIGGSQGPSPQDLRARITVFEPITGDVVQQRRHRGKQSARRHALIVVAYVFIGVAGSITITRLSVGRFPWETATFTHTTAWRTFDGFLCVTFGFVFTIGMAMLLVNLVGSGVTCPRCFTRNPGAASVCLTCELPLPPRPTASLWRRWSSGSGTPNRPR
jgi:hypothetical protein